MTTAAPANTLSQSAAAQTLSRAPRFHLGRALGFAAALLLAQIGLLALCYFAALPFILGFIGHVSLLAIAALSVTRIAGDNADFTPYVVTLLATIATGAAGAALSVVAVVLLARQRPDAAMLDAWYERISQAGDVGPTTRLTTSIAMGRAVDTDRALPVSFEQVINSGSLSEQQSALGLIARKFSPEYAPALRAALVSTQPVIRVQAAAVAVKVRAEAASALALAIAQAQEPTLSVPTARDLAVQIDALVQSQLLEDFDRARGEDVRSKLLTGLVDAEPFEGLDLDLPTDRAARDLIETHLLKLGRYGDVRAARAARASRQSSEQHL